MNSFPTELLFRILTLLDPADLRRSRLVNGRWLLIAAEVLPNRHKVKFTAQRELRCFVSLSKYWMQPPLLTNFILDLSLVDLDSIALFATEFGRHVRSYTLSFTDLDSIRCRAKVATLIQHSANILSLTVLPSGLLENREQPIPVVGAELPVFPNLRWIVWENALYHHQLVIQILQSAPALQVFSCNGLLLSGFGESRTIYPVDLTHFLPHLPAQAQAEVKLPLHFTRPQQIPIIHRITAFKNRIRSLNIFPYEGSDMSLEWSMLISALLSTQAESLRALKISHFDETQRIPSLTNLETLTLHSGHDFQPGSILCPGDFPQLKTLELTGAELLTLFGEHVWPSIKSMRVTKTHETGDGLPAVIKLWEVFPNLFTAGLFLGASSQFLGTSSQRRALSFFMQNVWHVVELRLSFYYLATDDLWEELTGNASPTYSVHELLSEDFRPLEEERSRPNSFAGFTNLKKLWLGYSDMRKLPAICYASRLGDLRRLKLLTLRHFGVYQKQHVELLAPYLKLLQRCHDNVVAQSAFD